MRLISFSFLVFLAAVFWACSKPVEVAKFANSIDPIQRGEYLTTITGCGDCHTPLRMGTKGLEPDLNKHLSGHPEKVNLPNPPPLNPAWGWGGSGSNTAFFGPWGLTYAMNLTPDENTGIGIWTEEMFIRAMREGKHMGQSREIQRPMPWRYYAKMSTEDLKAIFAYLKSLRPIRNQVPDFEPPPGSEYE